MIALICFLYTSRWGWWIGAFFSSRSLFAILLLIVDKLFRFFSLFSFRHVVGGRDEKYFVIFLLCRHRQHNLLSFDAADDSRVERRLVCSDGNLNPEDSSSDYFPGAFWVSSEVGGSTPYPETLSSLMSQSEATQHTTKEPKIFSAEDVSTQELWRRDNHRCLTSRGRRRKSHPVVVDCARHGKLNFIEIWYDEDYFPSCRRLRFLEHMRHGRRVLRSVQVWGSPPITEKRLSLAEAKRRGE